jgi:FAD/FMN-containing dehydrogenase
LHGSSPDVGVTGYTLGGGIGWLARKYGLASSSVTAIEVVTPDGRLVRADDRTEPELFWAIRGGGGNFGIVTALEFRLYPVREVFAGWLVWPWEDTGRVLRAWSDWTAGVPDEVTSVGRVLQLPPLPEIPEPLRGRNLVVVEIAFLGDAAEGTRLVEPLVALAPEMNTLATIPAPALGRLHADPEGPTPGMGDGLLLDGLPPQAVEAFASATGPGSGSPFVSTEIRHLGGALGRPAPGGGALSMIDAAFAVFSIGIPMDDEQRSLIDRHLETLRRVVAPWGRGRGYFNFAERPIDPASAFGSDEYERLRRVRAELDPAALLVANHDLDQR